MWVPQSTDRLMAPALYTIEFALLSLLALGKGLFSWKLSWTLRATGPGPSGFDSIRRNEEQTSLCPEELGAQLREIRRTDGVGVGWSQA